MLRVPPPDLFLKGEVARLAGLALGLARGWLPEDYFDACFDRDTLVEVPAVPGALVYLAETRYAYYEASREKEERLDPR